MRLIVHTFLTIDGVMQGPGAPDEDTAGGFSRGGWLIPFADEGMGHIVNGWFARAEAILLGRRTYELMQAYWSRVTDQNNIAAVKLNGLPKYVASTTLHDPAWHDTTVLNGEAIEQVHKLKERPGGELQVHGSAGLAQTLHRLGLIDEYRLLVFPVTVGAGKRLFTDDAPASGYTLIDSSTTGSGAVHLVLQPRPYQTGTAEVVDGHEIV